MTDPRSLERTDHAELSGRVGPDDRDRIDAQLKTILELTRRMLIRLEG
jgi:hypothetical protein